MSEPCSERSVIDCLQFSNFNGFNGFLGEYISVNGQTYDIGIALITRGSVQVQWTNNQVHDQAYIIKDSWYGFICMLSSSRGEPFPKSIGKVNCT